MMMVNRRKKKSRKKRGSQTHGWGGGKRHRGAGHRGGRGHAGVGKRGGQKKTKYYSLGIKPIGKRGMRITRRWAKEKPINFKEIEQKLNSWQQKNLIETERDMFVVNLRKLGYTKLLSTGKISKKLKIICDKYSSTAKDKAEKAGGTVEA